MASAKDVVEGFHGVYLLVSMNPSMKKRTYIGYTVNPMRRIKQHNKGAAFGGARKTSSKGPWEMVLTIHGFPTAIAGLRFEWAWQHPKSSRRLRNLPGITNSVAFAARLKVMWTMLRTPPWSRLPLTIRWLFTPLVCEPSAGLAPPAHMPIVHGLVASKAISLKEQTVETDFNDCTICKSVILSQDLLSCLNPSCSAFFHIFCLSELFLANDSNANLIPVEGVCPQCEACMLWGDIIRKRNGCTLEVDSD